MVKAILALFATAAAFPTWEQYKSEQGLAFNGAEEDERQAIFAANVATIIEENLKGNSHMLEVSKFTHMTNDEFRSMTRGRKEKMFAGESKPHKLSAKANDLPASVDWRTESNIMTPAKDQGGCGSCWAFSAAQTFESMLAIATGEPVQTLSAQQIVSCAPNPQHCGGSGGCDGSTQPLALNYTQTAGITTEANYPYKGRTGTCDTSKVKPVAFNDGYAELTMNNYTELVTAVATKGPVAISIAAGGFTFQFYGGGVLTNCNDYVMDHAVQLVGYGTDSGKDYWLVRNSWGNWGEGGYIRMQRYGEGKEPCGTDASPQDGDACSGDTTARTYCGECGILSSSSYPTGMTAASELETTADIDCTTAVCESQCTCSLDKCASQIASCLADANCAKSQDCALQCPCSDNSCILKCAASAPSLKALPVAKCINSNCGSVLV